jgi:general secretion pathway protein M
MNNALELLKQRWAGLAPREQTLVKWSAFAVGLLLLWSVGLKPALTTLRAAPQQRAQAQATADRMQAQAAEAVLLRGRAGAAGATQGPVRTMETGVDEATRALLMAALGESTRVDAQGRHVTVTFDGVSGEQARQALQALRSRLQAQLIEAELAPSQEGLRGRFRFEWTAG